jgi:cell division septum initiation protein DivIVA
VRMASARERAEETAQDILTDAEDRAKTMVDEAEEKTSRLVSDADDRLAAIRLEREAVAGYFESLRGVLSQAEKVSNQD